MVRDRQPGEAVFKSILPEDIEPEDRIYTVISGVFYIGLGDRFETKDLKAYPPGSVVVLPGDTWHFHRAKSGEYVTQDSAIGPVRPRVQRNSR